MTNEAEVVTEQPEKVEVAPHEETARAQGWVSKEEWVEAGNNETDWRPAKEFVERGELFKKIHSTGRELKQTQAALSALQKHHQYVFEKAHQQAIADLKREKRDAIKNEDFERLEAIEEKLEEVQEQHETESKRVVAATQAPASGTTHPDFLEWQERNTWYVMDQDLKDFADARGLVYANRNPGVTPQQVLKFVETEVRNKFPEKFGVSRKAAPAPVAGRGATTKRGPSNDDVDLDETERAIMQTLVRSGTMTEQEYKAELKKVKKG